MKLLGITLWDEESQQTVVVNRSADSPVFDNISKGTQEHALDDQQFAQLETTVAKAVDSSKRRRWF